MTATRRDRGLLVRPRDLSRRLSQSERWREVAEGAAPRLAPHEVIGRGTTRAGRFREVDPLATPALWSRWRWLALILWAGLLGGSGWRAWRAHGGIAWPTENDGL